jgi:hypothetical protein
VLKPANDRLLLDEIARQAIERFDQEHFKLAGEGISDTRSRSWPAIDRRRAANGAVRVHRDDGQSESGCPFAAEASLILDRRDGLQLGAEAGIDDGAHGMQSSVGERRSSTGRPSTAARAASSASNETSGARFTAFSGCSKPIDLSRPKSPARDRGPTRD